MPFSPLTVQVVNLYSILADCLTVCLQYKVKIKLKKKRELFCLISKKFLSSFYLHLSLFFFPFYFPFLPIYSFSSVEKKNKYFILWYILHHSLTFITFIFQYQILWIFSLYRLLISYNLFISIYILKLSIHFNSNLIIIILLSFCNILPLRFFFIFPNIPVKKK